jgi:fructose-1-phosphate kinase PfkB-like protein
LRPHDALTDDGAGDTRTGGFTAEAAHRSTLHHTVTPSVSEKGWSTGGMAIPALIIVALIGSLIALAF